MSKRKLVKGDNRESISAFKAQTECKGGEEAHAEHLRINGECPWCDVYYEDLVTE